MPRWLVPDPPFPVASPRQRLVPTTHPGDTRPSLSTAPSPLRSARSPCCTLRAPPPPCIALQSLNHGAQVRADHAHLCPCHEGTSRHGAEHPQFCDSFRRPSREPSSGNLSRDGTVAGRLALPIRAAFQHHPYQRRDLNCPCDRIPIPAVRPRATCQSIGCLQEARVSPQSCLSLLGGSRNLFQNKHHLGRFHLGAGILDCARQNPDCATQSALSLDETLHPYFQPPDGGAQPRAARLDPITTAAASGRHHVGKHHALQSPAPLLLALVFAHGRQCRGPSFQCLAHALATLGIFAIPRSPYHRPLPWVR